MSNRTGAFIAINCAAIPEELAEAELFGVETGAFTGAQKRMGKIEAADGGTLYLDEIDSMPRLMQAKLLRALQEKGSERIGSNKFIASNFRIIASTKVDLLQSIAQKQFREDLYYRLNTVHLHIPELVQRPEDILPIFYANLANYVLEFGVPMPNIQPAMEQQLMQYPWPGNVRELLACAQRCAIGLPLELSTAELLDAPTMHTPQLSQLSQLPQPPSTLVGTDSFSSIIYAAAQSVFEQLHPSIYQAVQQQDSAHPLLMPAHVPAAGFDLTAAKQLFEQYLLQAHVVYFKQHLTQAAVHLNLPLSTLHYKLKQKAFK